MKLPSIIHPSWIPHLTPLFELPKIAEFKNSVLPTGKYYPEKHNIFRVFSMPLEDIKVVILGQDPYPKKGQANGFAFAVNKDVNIPFSLKTIYKELFDEGIHDYYYEDGNQWRTLEHWHKQGVFLLNTALTVRPGTPGSHYDYWLDFTRGVVQVICEEVQPIWLIWGNKAKEMAWDIIYPYHEQSGHKHGKPDNRTMTCSHPASEYHNPGNGGFLGCNHFKKVNEMLISIGKAPINW